MPTMLSMPQQQLTNAAVPARRPCPRRWSQFAGADATGKSTRGKFGDSLAELDNTVRLLRAAVEALPTGNTVFVFTSDNGPSLRNEVRGGNAGPLRCGKGTTWEGGLRVPGIVWWPGACNDARARVFYVQACCDGAAMAVV